MILTSLRPCRVTIKQIELDAIPQGSCHWRVELYQFLKFSHFFLQDIGSYVFIQFLCSWQIFVTLLANFALDDEIQVFMFASGNNQHMLVFLYYKVVTDLINEYYTNFLKFLMTSGSGLTLILRIIERDFLSVSLSFWTVQVLYTLFLPQPLSAPCFKVLYFSSKLSHYEEFILK